MFTAQKITGEFAIGDTVTFVTARDVKRHYGTVLHVGPVDSFYGKNIVVRCDDGTEWRCTPSCLSHYRAVTRQ